MDLKLTQKLFLNKEINMINRVCLTGRLTKDVELMKTQYGNVVSHITLAVDRNFKKDGQQNTDFINCVAFGKQAEAMNNYLSKGYLIGIDGRIQTRNYKNKQGQTVYVTEVIVDSFSFLESKKKEAYSHTGVKPDPQAYVKNDDDFVGLDIQNEDLPF